MKLSEEAIESIAFRTEGWAAGLQLAGLSLSGCRELEKANLFLIPLDSKREWYRYHHLFADSLRAELSKGEEQELQKKAALWFEGTNFKQEAVNSVRKAWALYITGRMSEAIEYLNSLGEDYTERTTSHNKGLILSLKALIARQVGLNDSEKLAVETFRKAYNEGLKLGYTFITTISLTYLGTCLNSIAKRKEAVELYLSYIEGMTKEFGKPHPFVGLVYIGLAELYYESNELEVARDYM